MTMMLLLCMIKILNNNIEINILVIMEIIK